MITVLALLFTSSAFADWQSKLHVKVQRQGSSPITIVGTMRARKDRQRLDFKPATPGAPDVSTIIDLRRQKAWTIVHDKKSILESDLSSVNSNVPACATNEIDECLKKQGFVKAGSEKLAGHPCTIYVKEMTEGPESAHTTTKVWRPEDLKEVPALKTTMTDSAGNLAVETVMKDVKTTEQAESHFELPKGYKAMSMLDMMKAFEKQGGKK